MLTYSFENAGSDSLYEYLYKCIKNDILNGTLPPDYKLPSKRSFAKNLGVSTITVENSYAQLIAEGYIYSLPKKGYYVSDISQLQILKPAEIISSHEPDSKQNSYIADITTNHTNTDSFPFYTWSKLMKEVIAERSSDLLISSPCGGIFELRNAISSHLKAFRGMNIKPEQIIVGAGTEYLYGLLIQLLGRNNTFAVEDPGYHKLRLIYQSNNVNCISLPMTFDGIDINAVNESTADILHLSPSHHYPTGIVTSISRRYELLNWALQNDRRYIIEDDYDCEFRLLGKPIPSLQSIDISGRVIYMNTFTKTLASTIRISYMVLPPNLLKRFNETLMFYSCTVSNFEQYTLARFISAGHFEKHINRMRIYYRKQRDALINAINESHLASLVTIHEENAGLHFLMKVNTDLTDIELVENARKNGLKITCLSQYYTSPEIEDTHTLVVNYSGITEKMIENVVELLYKTINCDLSEY